MAITVATEEVIEFMVVLNIVALSKRNKKNNLERIFKSEPDFRRVKKLTFIRKEKVLIFRC